MLNIIKSPITAAVLIAILLIVIWRIGIKEKDEAIKEQNDLKKEIECLKNQIKDNTANRDT